MVAKNEKPYDACRPHDVSKSKRMRKRETILAFFLVQGETKRNTKCNVNNNMDTKKCKTNNVGISRFSHYLHNNCAHK